MARFKVLSGPAQVEACELTATATTIGRARANTLRFSHGSVSKYHLLIISDEDGCFLFDLDSTNGTYLNNQRVSSAPVKHGDHVRLGEFVLEYDSPETAPTAQPTAAETVVTASPAPPQAVAIVESEAAPTSREQSISHDVKVVSVTAATASSNSEPPASVVPSTPPTSTTPEEPPKGTGEVKTVSVVKPDAAPEKNQTISTAKTAQDKATLQAKPTGQGAEIKLKAGGPKAGGEIKLKHPGKPRD